MEQKQYGKSWYPDGALEFAGFWSDGLANGEGCLYYRDGITMHFTASAGLTAVTARCIMKGSGIRTGHMNAAPITLRTEKPSGMKAACPSKNGRDTAASIAKTARWNTPGSGKMTAGTDRGVSITQMAGR